MYILLKFILESTGLLVAMTGASSLIPKDLRILASGYERLIKQEQVCPESEATLAPGASAGEKIPPVSDGMSVYCPCCNCMSS
jgi:hypothetical protein